MGRSIESITSQQIHRPPAQGGWWRDDRPTAKPHCELLESRDVAGSLLSELVIPALAVFGDAVGNSIATSAWTATTVEVVGRGTARPDPAPVLLPGADKPGEPAVAGGPRVDRATETGFVELLADDAHHTAWAFLPVDDARPEVPVRGEGGRVFGPPAVIAAGVAANGGRPAAADLLLAPPTGERVTDRQPTDTRPKDSPAGVRREAPPSDIATATASGSEAVNAATLPAWANPNGPVATNNSYTVAEDTSVTFDPTLDDTDADGDAIAIADWPSTTANGVVLRESDGKLKYIPNPDYYSYQGPDQFEYTITDGQKTSTATISLTVTPVNDPVQAYNDAFVFYRPPAPPPVPPSPPYVVGFNVLANDTDWDGDSVRAVAGTIVLGGGAGTVTIGDDGACGWKVGPSFFGQTSFTYQATDQKGSTSSATVILWTILQGTPGKPVTANGDVFPVGRDAISGSVIGNDYTDPGLPATPTNTIAILDTRPAIGRLTAFGLDGGFSYTPHWGTAHASFKYKLFRADGLGVSTADAKEPKVSFKIFHGVDPIAVGRLVQDTPGAFTVANLNDSNVNGKQDKEDDDVPARADAPGSGEVDLIRIEVPKPNDLRQDNPRKVKFEVTQGGDTVQLWNLPTKGGKDQKVTLTNNAVEFGLNEFPAADPKVKVLWAELTAISKSVGDVQFKLTYDNQSDTARATGIWVDGGNTKDDPFDLKNKWTGADFYNTQAQITPWPAGADDPLRETFALNTGTQAGLFNNRRVNNGPNGIANDIDDNYRTANSAIMRFRPLPDGLSSVSPATVRIDIGRTIDERVAFKAPDGKWYYNTDKRPGAWLDVTNDYIGNSDQATDLWYPDASGKKPLSTPYVFVGDPPGTPIGLTRGVAADFNLKAPDGVGRRAREIVQQFNVYEFVRIQIDSDFDAIEAAQGSRASPYFFWHTRLSIRSIDPGNGAPRVWERVGPATDNEIDTGHRAITTPPAG